MLKVLIADDIHTNVRLLEHLVKQMGYQPLLTYSGREAVECYQNEQPDIVLLDVMMDDMDGFEAAAKIQDAAAPLWVPILFLSAAATDQHYLQGLQLGAYDYIFKPVNRQVLEAKFATITQILDYQKQLRQENQQLIQQLQTQQ